MSDRTTCNHALGPTIREIIQRIQIDPSFPLGRRAGVSSSLRCLLRWLGRRDAVSRDFDAADVVLTERAIAVMFRALAPSALGISRKRIRNAESDLRFAFSFYGAVGAQPTNASSEPMQALKGIVSDRFAEMTLRPLLAYLASNGIDPWSVSDDDAEAFRETLWGDSAVRWPRRAARRAIQAWNTERARNHQWPQIKLMLRDTRSRWGSPWSAFPETLARAVDEFFCQDQDNGDLFSAGRLELAPATRRAQKDLLRLAASALARSGVEPAAIVGLRELCSPSAFRAAVGQIAGMNGGVNSTAQNVAHVLRKVAKLSGTLSPEEIAEVEEAHKNVRRHFERRAFPRMDRDQKVLDRFDDARFVDAFLSLAARTVAQIRRSQRFTKREAIQVQLALALEILLCAPLRIKNLVALSLDRHFFNATLNGIERTLIRISGEETKTGEPAEHFLTEDAARLLRLYVEVYRPLIAVEATEWVFPGGTGSHKTENTLGTQLTRWVRGELGIPFHAHLIRKIAPKIYLDVDPGGLEVVRRQLGHRSDAMLRKTYLQKVHRASQQKYIEALESRRLSAFGIARIGRARATRSARG